MDFDLLTIMAVITCLGVLGMLMLLGLRVRSQASQIDDLTGRVEYLASNLNALCSGAVGVDQRVSRLEQKGRDLEYRQESMETHQHSERPYGSAIHMVHQGATVNRLMDELGLSRSEAELLVSMHGAQKAG
ncbi:MAG: DUF2802 domain-containing protein [Candidatus Sedimenticola sp. PURPLELP]